jgi:hypothetical protein
MSDARGMVTISVDVIRVTDKAVQVNDRGVEVWIPYSQIEDVVGNLFPRNKIKLTLPIWLAEAKDLL